MKPLLLSLALGLSCAAAAPPQLLVPAPVHLGVAGLPEWEEFATSRPVGPQLDLSFGWDGTDTEHTLVIRQRNVKVGWQVLLNDRPLGSLETLTTPLYRALPVPAGTLRRGQNRLVIRRTPGPMLDDIEVGEIRLLAQPRTAWLSQTEVRVLVRDEHARVIPSRITVVDREGALLPLLAEPADRLAVRTGVVYTGGGEVTLRLPPGAVTVYAGRGFEYSVAERKMDLPLGAQRREVLEIRREVPTPGWIAADTHIHTLTHSRHGDATGDERMLTIAGEGIELAVATDHNHAADFGPAARRMGTDAHFVPVVGNEVTTPIGHFNAFPVPATGAAPAPAAGDWHELLARVRSVTGARVITLNHPRDVHQGFTPFGPDNFDPRTGELRGGPRFDFDAIEVVTSAAMQSDVELLFRDWFALLNRGFRVAGLGASDTHHVSEYILGQARTYVQVPDDTPGQTDLEAVWESFRHGRLLVSMGLLTHLTVDGRLGAGELVAAGEHGCEVEIRVLGPSWVRADRLVLFANGERVREARLEPTAEVEKGRVRWQLPRPARDTYLVALATGPGVTAPYWEIPRPYQAASRVFTPRVIGATNPVWIDADGDGAFTAPGETVATEARER